MKTIDQQLHTSHWFFHLFTCWRPDCDRWPWNRAPRLSRDRHLKALEKSFAKPPGISDEVARAKMLFLSEAWVAVNHRYNGDVRHWLMSEYPLDDPPSDDFVSQWIGLLQDIDQALGAVKRDYRGPINDPS